MLNWIRKKVALKWSQFGGVKGCGVDHLLIHLWQRICEDLEDCRAGSLITSIDYAKAFNRLSFQECLQAFARKGASSEILSLIATFLTNCTMSVRVGEEWSTPLPVFGGVPQGSIIGVMLLMLPPRILRRAWTATPWVLRVMDGLNLLKTVLQSRRCHTHHRCTPAPSLLRSSRLMIGKVTSGPTLMHPRFSPSGVK